MVTMMVSDAPSYDLDDVRKAAKAGRVQYHGRRVSVDTAELGYQLDDVIRCLLSLAGSEYRKTHRYPESNLTFDEYLTRFPRPGSDDEVDSLYVKFALINGQLTIQLASFHLPRYG